MPPNRHTGLAMTPRRWQAEALPAVGAALRAGGRPVVVACTGAGKANLAAELCRLLSSVAGSSAVVVSAPTKSLVKQLRHDVAGRIGEANVGAWYTGEKRADRAVVIVCNASIPTLVEALAVAGRGVHAWIADECHRTASERVDDAIRAADPKYLMGFTATPFRSVDTESLRLFDSVAYRYTMEQAIREGVLVPYDVVHVPASWGEVLIDDACVRMIREQAPEGPGVVGASSIPDAEAFAERLAAEGIPAAVTHSQMAAEAQADVLRRLKAGTIRCVVHVAMLIEGVDLPWLTWLCLRRPLTSPVATIQQIGRVLRTYPGKSRAVILDPHALLMGPLGRPDSIGELEAAAEAEAQGEPREAGVAGTPEQRWAVCVSEGQQWALRVLRALAASGALEVRVSGSAWRHAPATSSQVASLERMGRAWSRYLPEEVAAGIGALRAAHVLDPLDRGTVSDLLSVLSAVASQAPEGGWEERAGWSGPTWPEGMEWPELREGVAAELLRQKRAADRRKRKEVA
jgi:hypothetical protein